MTAPHLNPRARKILLIASGIWLVLTVLALSVGPWSIGTLENRLQRAAEAALAERSHDWALVDVDGQVATVSGAAPHDYAREDALATVLASTWSGGKVAGGITRVIDATTDARQERGFAFRADASSDYVRVVGDVPTRAAGDEIERLAAESFSTGSAVDLVVVPGGAAEDWLDASTRLIGQLARLENGALVLNGFQGALTGAAANPELARSVAAALEAMPEPFTIATFITPAGAEPIINIADPAACDVLILAAVGSSNLRFDQGAATLNPFAQAALTRVGEAFLACPDTAVLSYTVDVDAAGDDLAAQRAGTVRALFEEMGVDGERIRMATASDQVRMISLAVTTNEG